jgi:pimeloyl-ACP methyl ester carboxylesterase
MNHPCSIIVGGIVATVVTFLLTSNVDVRSANADDEKRSRAAFAPRGWTRQVVSNDQARLEIFLKGKGAAVLMHPSLGRPASDFEDLGNRVVAAGYRVILINPRGIGGSTGLMENLTLHDLAADVWRVADDLKIDRGFVLGQNFGNRVAQTVSTDKPDRVIGLVLLAAGGEVPPSKEDLDEFLRIYDF